MKTILFSILICVFTITAGAQPQFITTGRITYERKINMWSNLPPEFADQFKKAIPQYKSDLFDLTFDANKSLYTPVPAKNDVKKNFFDTPAGDNIVYSDFKTDQYVALKNVFEKTYQIRDSLAHITWKIKDDFREIAGFNCRRATTILFDSVFVVAFYTDEIVPPGGPESFNGLPGTILGLVINRIHTTWYATKVELDNVNSNTIVPPAKGTPATRNELEKQLQKSFSSWGKEGQKFQWMVLL